MAGGGGAASDAAIRELRARIEWVARRELGDPVRRLNRLLRDPWFFAKAIAFGFGKRRDRARAVAEHHGVGIAPQLLRYTVDHFAHRIDLYDFYSYGFFLPERRKARSRHLGFHSHVRPVQTYLYWDCPDRLLLASKSRFAKRCEEAELPTIPLLAEFVNGEMRLRQGPELPPMDLFSKPSERWRGIGANLWRYDGIGKYVNAKTGERCDQRQLLDQLCKESMSGEGPIILQTRAVNHSNIRLLTSGGLSTVRLVSCRAPSGEIDFLPPVIRMPMGRSIVDSQWQGGLAAPIDLASGRICGPAVRLDKMLGITRTERHPDTGAEIAGFELPYWDRAVELARRAHLAFPSLPFVGWDVAILQDHPVILEGNILWSTDLTLLPHGISLADTQFVSYCNFHLDEKSGRCSRT